MIFVNQPRRNQFMARYQAFVSTRPRILDRTVALDQEVGDDGEIFPLPPTVRLDVVFTMEGDSEILFADIRDIRPLGLVRLFMALHKCRIEDPEQPPVPHPKTRYYSFP